MVAGTRWIPILTNIIVDMIMLNRKVNIEYKILESHTLSILNAKITYCLCASMINFSNPT